MESHTCPFCNSELTSEHKIVFIDYHCSGKDHTFVKREHKGKLIQLKMRLNDSKSGDKLYLKICYDEGTTQVWKHSNDALRYSINETFIPDFSDVEALKAKIKTYLLFL